MLSRLPSVRSTVTSNAPPRATIPCAARTAERAAALRYRLPAARPAEGTPIQRAIAPHLTTRRSDGRDLGGCVSAGISRLPDRLVAPERATEHAAHRRERADEPREAQVLVERGAGDHS